MKYGHICKDFKSKKAPDASFNVLTDQETCETFQQTATTTVEFLFFLCWTKIEQESCRFARNPLKLWRLLVLVAPRR